MQVYFMKNTAVKTKLLEFDYSTAKILGIDYAMHGMAVFSEDIQKENEGFSEKVKKTGKEQRKLSHCVGKS